MFLSRRWRPNKWPFLGMVALELPLTVGLLILFGIASPDLYRTKLWQDGSDNGFNSSPLDQLYAAANYRPYTVPKVWSQLYVAPPYHIVILTNFRCYSITNYNVVISVLSLFMMLVKSIMYVVHCFPPILSIAIHAILIALYVVSISYQAASDTSDPQHPQNGPPWYITKSCSVTHNPALVGSCQQAKASFALTCSITGVFALYLGHAIWSCIPSKEQKLEYSEKKKTRAERYRKFDEEGHDANAVPQTPGPQTGLYPMTPRTLAFNTLGGTKGLPLRTHFSSPNAPASPSYAVRSPDLPRSPMSPGFKEVEFKADEATSARSPSSPQLYFPPPPKASNKK